MKQYQRLAKYAALTVVIAAAAAGLSGCVSKPDQNGNNQNGAPFMTLAPDVNQTDAPKVTIASVSTPEPENTPNLLWNVGTPAPGSSSQPGVFATPSGTGLTIVTKSPTGTPAPTATPFILKLGSKGPDVTKLQKRLKELGYYKGSADGDFGPGTDTALKAFQKRNGLTADGIAGKATVNRLYSNQAKKVAITAKPTAKTTPKPTKRATATPKISDSIYLRLGDSGREVSRMQERLITLGYLSGKASGRFDASTEKAVYAFQKRNVSYADGVAGPMTLKALYSSNAKGTTSSSGVVGVSLRKGMRDSTAVRNMQTRLRALGYYSGSSDGAFGDSTEAAVKAFQANNNLKPDGVAGDGTLGVLYSDSARSAGYNGGGSKPTPRITPIPKPTPIVNYINVTPNPSGGYVTLREGHSGTLVRNLQQALKNQGYLSGNVDGKYGAGTVDAVTRFQENHGLSQDGVAGPATQRVLFEGNYPIGS